MSAIIGRLTLDEIEALAERGNKPAMRFLEAIGANAKEDD